MATVHDFDDIDQGAQWTKHLTWLDESEAPVDLTGYTARMQVRRRVNSTGDPLVELTTENGGITLGGTAGTIELLIEASETAELPATPFDRRWYYDLEMLAGGVEDQARRLVQGRFVVSPEVTR